MIYFGEERRKSSPGERKVWRDSHPVGVATVCVASLILGLGTQLLYAANPAESLSVLKDSLYTVFGLSGLLYIGQRLIVFAINHVVLRMEKVNALPEKFETLEKNVADQIKELRQWLEARDLVQDEKIKNITRRLDDMKV